MKRFIILLAITALAISTLSGCGSSDKKEGSSGLSITAIDSGYIGTNTCLGCHDGSVAPDKRSFLETGHPYKYTHTGGAVMATSTIPGLYTRPGATDNSYIDTSSLDGLIVPDAQGLLDWSAINYTVGGYGWKIRWGIRDTIVTDGTGSTGYLWSGPKTQFNIVNDSWSPYPPNGSITNKKYECAVCHNTNGIVSTPNYDCATNAGTNAAPARTQPWAKNSGMGPDTHGGYNSSWTFDGVQCEACHGPGQSHATTNSSMGVLTLAGGIEICAKCHIRAENTVAASANAECGGDANPNSNSNLQYLTNGAVANGDWISHHEQYNEMVGYNWDGAHSGLKCTTCHDPHKRAHRVTNKVAAFLGITGNDQPATGAIKVSCVAAGCHGPKPNTKAAAHDTANITCADCHMAEATKSATASPTTGWGRKADVKTHIFKIDPTGTSITRSNGAKTIATNYLTPRYTCGKCHDININPSAVTQFATEGDAQTAATNYHTGP